MRKLHPARLQVEGEEHVHRLQPFGVHGHGATHALIRSLAGRRSSVPSSPQWMAVDLEDQVPGVQDLEGEM